MVIGPAGAGKSSLAHAIGQSRGVQVTHLDLLFHQPQTDWVPRPKTEFTTLHEQAVAAPAWIIDGNYRAFMQPRLARATGLIWLDPPLISNFWKYLQRCFTRRKVPGRLVGGSERIKWLMVHHILVVQPRSHSNMREMFEAFPGMKVRVGSLAEMRRLFQVWKLPDTLASPSA